MVISTIFATSAANIYIAAAVDADAAKMKSSCIEISKEEGRYIPSYTQRERI